MQDTLPAHCRSFAPEWQRSTIEVEQTAVNTLESHYNAHAQHLPDIKLGANVALQNPRTKLWEIYGRVVNISLYRRYSVKTQSGHILVCNRRFLRHRTPALQPLCVHLCQAQHNQTPVNIRKRCLPTAMR